MTSETDIEHAQGYETENDHGPENHPLWKLALALLILLALWVIYLTPPPADAYMMAGALTTINRPTPKWLERLAIAGGVFTLAFCGLMFWLNVLFILAMQDGA